MLLRRLVFIISIVALPTIIFSQESIDRLIFDRQYDKALQLISRKLENRRDYELLVRKGQVYTRLQKYREAIAVFRECLETEPSNPFILAEIADACNALGNSAEAVQWYRDAIRFDPDNNQLKGNLARTLITLREFRNAYILFDEIFRTDSTNIYWNKQLAFCCYKTGKADRAIGLYENILGQNPLDLGTYLNLAGIYEQKKQYDRTISTLEAGLLQFPANSELLLKLANHYFSTRFYEKAVEPYRNYIGKNEPEFDVLKNFGISLCLSKMENEAVPVLEKCVEMVVNDPYVLFYLGLSHKKLAHLEFAADYMKTAIESATPYYMPELYHHLGQIYGLQRKFEESIDALKKANEMDPENHELLFEIATTYEEFGKNRTIALNYYQLYLNEAGMGGKNSEYAQARINRIKEDMFFEK